VHVGVSALGHVRARKQLIRTLVRDDRQRTSVPFVMLRYVRDLLAKRREIQHRSKLSRIGFAELGSPATPLNEDLPAVLIAIAAIEKRLFGW